MASILVVDDSAVIRHILGYTLKREGYDVTAVSSGQEALAHLANTVVDLAIVDLDMPEMNGIALLQAIRAEEQLAPVQLIMLTASGQDQDRLKAEAAGVNSFLTKPASSRDLLDAVGQVLEQAGRSDEVHPPA